jgi:hypothetical protein
VRNQQAVIKAATAALPANRKKRIEVQYIDEARRASSILPTGELVPHEKSDFLLRTDRGTIGIEVTELCREQQRAEGGRLSKVAGKAMEFYCRMATAGPIDVSAAFAPDTEGVSFRQLTKGHASFVLANLCSSENIRSLLRGKASCGCLLPF